MKSLIYLVRTEAKNNLKELLQKPAKLVLYLLVILGIGAAILGSLVQENSQGSLPSFWLKGIYFSFLILFLILGIQKSLTSGDAIFDMSDVNLLFVSPVDSRSTLLYGLIRLTKTSFWAGFFILFQSSTLSRFGVNFGGILVIFFTFILNTMVLSILSLVLYSVSNGNPKRKRMVKLFTALPFVPLIVYFIIQYLTLQNPTAALQEALGSPFLNAIPFAGWTAAGTTALLEGNLLTGLGFLGLLLLTGVGLLIFILRSRADYYEDVLVATETAFEKKRAVEEGDLQSVSLGNAKVKVTRTGVGGTGASSIFYKHLRETFRQSKFGFFSTYSIFLGICILAASIFLRGSMDTLLILQILLWMQIFMIGTGRGLKETYLHYIYLIPVSPFQKLVWSNLELVFKTLIESVFFLGIPGLILADNPFVIVAAMLTYTAFSLLVLGVNYFSMRFSEANISQGILIVLYFLFVILAMLPGLIPAMIVGFSIGGSAGAFWGLLILLAWELIAGLSLFAASKGVLHNCDMPSAKPGGK